jgi:hypothetical protein
MKRNFNELFSKMKPAAQERVKARSGELLNEISLMEIEGAITADDVRTPSADANSLSSEESLPQRR